VEVSTQALHQSTRQMLLSSSLHFRMACEGVLKMQKRPWHLKRRKAGPKIKDEWKGLLPSDEATFLHTFAYFRGLQLTASCSVGTNPDQRDGSESRHRFIFCFQQRRPASPSRENSHVKEATVCQSSEQLSVQCRALVCIS
jgi:hypothetical protein